MDYEKIERPQKDGGLSPAKLRSMLMGLEKKRREVEEVDSSCSLRSQISGVDDPVFTISDFSESCKDVDVVRELVECSISTANSKIVERELKGQPLASSRIRLNEEFEVDYGSQQDNLNVSSSAFEFQKTDRAAQRVAAARFSKAAPSKWDDAQKWIATPTSNRARTCQSHGIQSAKKANNFNHGVRKPFTKVVSEVPDGDLGVSEEPETKMIDSTVSRKENTERQLVKWESDPYLAADFHEKTTDMIEHPIDEPAVCLTQHDSSLSIQGFQMATDFVPTLSIVRSVSMKEMGTEMTPIASQEPSRTGTPVRVKSPMYSPTSSRTSTPKRAHPPEAHAEPRNNNVGQKRKEFSEREMQMKTRKEIMELGMQLGKMNITSWACKEEGDTIASASLDKVEGEEVPRTVVQTRAQAWEEAEKVRYLARFEREEMQIQAWEDHQMAKTEAEMRKIEVEVERMKAKAQDKLMSKLAAVRHKAEEKREAAEAKMHRQAAKSEQQADYIRKMGRVPSKFSCWSCCC